MKLSPKVKTQAARIVRLFVVAFLSTGVLSGGFNGWSAIAAAVVAAAEATWRQIKPAPPAQNVEASK